MDMATLIINIIPRLQGSVLSQLAVPRESFYWYSNALHSCCGMSVLNLSKAFEYLLTLPSRTTS